jgi:membrane associated rhomboid family serine protease
VILITGILSVVMLILLLGAFLIWIPLVVLLGAVAVIVGLLRAYFQRAP